MTINVKDNALGIISQFTPFYVVSILFYAWLAYMKSHNFFLVILAVISCIFLVAIILISFLVKSRVNYYKFSGNNFIYNSDRIEYHQIVSIKIRGGGILKFIEIELENSEKFKIHLHLGNVTHISSLVNFFNHYRISSENITLDHVGFKIKIVSINLILIFLIFSLYLGFV